jgi:hypothetical protein
MELTLCFHGPFPVCSEIQDILADCSFRSEAGVYLWTVKQQTGRYRVSYLGETKVSFYERTKEHIIQTFGGNYRILDADQTTVGIERVVWDGLWRKNSRHKLPEFLRNYETLTPLIKRYLLSQNIFVAPLNCEVRLQRRVEGAIAQHLRSDANFSSLLPGDIRFVARKTAEPPISVMVSADAHIEGLSEKISA